MSLNYISLDKAYEETFLARKFDLENTVNHVTKRSYEETMEKADNMKAKGELPIHEQQCSNHLLHIQNCYECAQKLKFLINKQIQETQAMKKKKEDMNQKILFIVIALCVVIFFLLWPDEPEIRREYIVPNMYQTRFQAMNEEG